MMIKKVMKPKRYARSILLSKRETIGACINILLKYMSMLDNNCCDTIRDILPELIEYENFILYMRELPFQTNQMINKQTLKM